MTDSLAAFVPSIERVPKVAVEVLVPAARVKFQEAAKFLGISERQFDRLVEDGVFTAQRDGTGHGFHRSFMYDELCVYLDTNRLTGDAKKAKEAVQEFRRQKAKGEAEGSAA